MTVLLAVDLEQAPQAEVVWPWVLWCQTTTAKMEKSFQAHPVIHQTVILLQRHHQCPLIRRRRYLEFLQRREAEVRRRHHPLEVRHQCWEDHQAQILLVVYHQCHHHHHRHPL